MPRFGSGDRRTTQFADRRKQPTESLILGSRNAQSGPHSIEGAEGREKTEHERERRVGAFDGGCRERAALGRTAPSLRVHGIAMGSGPNIAPFPGVRGRADIVQNDASEWAFCGSRCRPERPSAIQLIRRLGSEATMTIRRTLEPSSFVCGTGMRPAQPPDRIHLDIEEGERMAQQTWSIDAVAEPYRGARSRPSRTGARPGSTGSATGVRATSSPTSATFSS